MAVTINGTSGITFPDATSLATAPTGASTDAGGVGSYFAGWSTTYSNYYSDGGVTLPGSTVAGSTLRNMNTFGAPFGSVNDYLTTSAGFTGTWRIMSSAKGQNQSTNGIMRPFLFVRVS